MRCWTWPSSLSWLLADPPEKTMQELGNEFLLTIGNCITEWAAIEEQLFEICLMCLACPRDRAAIVYYRTPSIDARLHLADELVKAALPKRVRKDGGHDRPDVDHWRTIYEDFKAHCRRWIDSPTILAPRTITRGIFGSPGALMRGFEPPKPTSNTWFEIYTRRTNNFGSGQQTCVLLRIDALQNHLVATSSTSISICPTAVARFNISTNKLSAHPSLVRCAIIPQFRRSRFYRVTRRQNALARSA
jgi:hypothetical protein